MERRSDQVVADRNNQNITSSTNRLITLVFQNIVGGNTIGLVQAGSLRLRLLSAVSCYEAIVDRDSKQISVLAGQFATLDQDLSNQLRNP